MFYQSFQFALFFLAVYGLYLASNHRWQNRWLLAASFLFYASWGLRFLCLLVSSIVINYFAGKKIGCAQEASEKRLFLFWGVSANLILLGLFKYFGFLIHNVAGLVHWLGWPLELHPLHLLLPVGISFYTFRSMTYLIDIYRDQLKPAPNLPDFALFVSFFPELMAGPIERAKHFMPQILSPRKLTLDQFYEGCYLVFWGLFQKIFVADNLAKIVDPIFSTHAPYNGVKVLLASYAFTFQLYCDFAGYSDIARGLGKMLGFDLAVNFNAPFFATNIQEFWNRWHITLSSWVRDYLYTPLFLSLRNFQANVRLYVSVIISMALIGLWHGAGWTFIAFGLYHGFLMVAYAMLRNRIKGLIQPRSRTTENLWLGVRIFFMFNLISIGMIIFRAGSMSQVFQMFNSLMFQFIWIRKIGLRSLFCDLAFFSAIALIYQWIQWAKKDLVFILRARTAVRAAFYATCFYLLLIFGVNGGKEFIYVQF